MRVAQCTQGHSASRLKDCSSWEKDQAYAKLAGVDVEQGRS